MEGKPSISEMATDTDSDVTKLKGTKIYVLVEDALFDVLVVSFQFGTKIFQGALLDITKKNAPYGIVPPAPEVPKDEENVSSTNGNGGTEEKIDKLYALKQRHTYYQVPPGTHFFFGPYRRNAKDKNVRMRRLRPRKVLCSHCQEVVHDDSNQKRVPGVVTRNTANKGNLQQQSNGTNESEIGANTGSVANQRIATRSTKLDSSDKSDSASTNTSNEIDVKNELIQENTESKTNESIRSNIRGEKMVLRKRKSTDVDSSDSSGASPEKLKRVDALKTEAGAAAAGSNAVSSKQGLAKTSPVIKISFANPQGKDTVLKIPARIKNASDTEEDSNWSLQENSDYSTKNFSSAKAAKKALKKAKKEAQKRAATTATSPTSTTVLSPSNENGDASATEKEKHHHHKHKVKRKRKHKNGETEAEKFDLENTDTRNVFNTTNGNDGWCLRTSFPGDISSSGDLNKSANMFEDVKNKCLHQKLSISLKRLNAKAYMRCSPKYSIEEDSVASDVSSASNVSVCSGSGSDFGDVPDFPKHSSPLRDMDKVKPLMMRISTHNVKKCVLDLGREMSVGDIVWGKIHGFPYWPGKVLALSVSQRDNGGTANQQAHVSWFGSSTSSYMPCNQLTPFLDDFKIRFNKKKRGPYKEAIKQAMHEAQLPHNDLGELGFTPS
ncbi:PWWP domain-containing protein 2A [Araneus ventricosus]|uniref:PWWP domain-containing protein 2A n=1 Tax=Araneus ventricosus TaxID=182803 RepID=A0A4Y2DG29_ARAVE|nr:PWWP domain-containing protein 2A [Araneus ventricosus]